MKGYFSYLLVSMLQLGLMAQAPCSGTTRPF